MSQVTASWILRINDEELQISVDTQVYPVDTLMRVCYLFTDRCYLFLAPAETGPAVTVTITRKDGTSDLAAISGDFANELINQKVRADIAAETRSIRELIVAQAFAEADLLDRTDQKAAYNVDPRGITR